MKLNYIAIYEIQTNQFLKENLDLKVCNRKKRVIKLVIKNLVY